MRATNKDPPDWLGAKAQLIRGSERGGADDLIAEERSWALPAARAARVVNETVQSVRAAIDTALSTV